LAQFVNTRCWCAVPYLSFESLQPSVARAFNYCYEYHAKQRYTFHSWKIQLTIK